MFFCTRIVQKDRRRSACSIFFFLLTVLSALPFFTPAAQAAQVTLAWDRNPDASIIGYRVYYGTQSRYYQNVVDVGNSTQAVLSGLVNGVTYYFAVTDYNASGESGFSNEVSYTVSGGPSPTSSGSGGGGGCFIATAAYGSFLEPEVVLLRTFRDSHLLTNTPGRIFVGLYYRYSPPLADFIRRNEQLRAMTRLALAPLVYTVKYPTLGILAVLILGVRVYRRVTGRSRKFF